VAGASNFIVRDRVIVTGYGFTSEPDFLYLLDRRDGSVVQRVRLRSAPEWILARGDRLYVRCYDTNYVFELVRR
jgi:hypothetical protein